MKEDAATCLLRPDADINVELRQHCDLRCRWGQHRLGCIEPELDLTRKENQLVLIWDGVAKDTETLLLLATTSIGSVSRDSRDCFREELKKLSNPAEHNVFISQESEAVLVDKDVVNRISQQTKDQEPCR